MTTVSYYLKLKVINTNNNENIKSTGENGFTWFIPENQ